MPAPIIRKIPGLHRRIVGLTQTQPLFTNINDQNSHLYLQNGVGGLQVEYDFIVNEGNQSISKLFDDRDDSTTTIKHNNKKNWLTFDLGKNRDLNLIILENGLPPGGGTNISQTLDASLYFWTAKQNPLTDTADLITNFSFNHQNSDEIKIDLSSTSTKYQYIGLEIKNIPNDYNQIGSSGPGYLNFKNFAIYESFDTRDYIVEFNDSVLDMHSWKGLRYNGCKTTSKKINQYHDFSVGGEGISHLQIGNNFIVGEYLSLDPWPGDITYGKTPNVQNRTTALYITSTIVGGTEEEDTYARIKNHSYIKIEKILIINLNDDTVKILDSQTEDFVPYHRFITTDFPTKGKFSLKLLDDNIQSNVQNEHIVKMNKGWLLKSFEYNADEGPLPGIDKDKITHLNTTSSHADNVLFSITNPLSLYDAVSGSIQNSDPSEPGSIFGFNARLKADNVTGEGLYGCQDDNEPCTGKDSASISAEISAFKEVFSYGPFYFSGSDAYNPNQQGDDTADGNLNHISVNKYNQHAGGNLRFRFGVAGNIDDNATTDNIPKQSFYPLYTGDNTRFIDNKFTREFIKQDNDSTLGVKNFILPTIDAIEFTTQSDGTSNPPFHKFIKDPAINPSITASLFIGQCIQYLNSHSQDTELHLTLFEGTKDFSGDNDEMSISTFEVDRNADPGYLDFASNVGKLYNSVGPRAKYIKLKNSPQFRPSIQPQTYDRFVYDVIDTTNFQATIEERQNAFVFGPGTPNSYLNGGEGIFANNAMTQGPYVSTYDNSPGNSGNFSGSFQYQLSFLDKDHTLIANLDKNVELTDGIGAKGAVLIPEHSHPSVKMNLFYYLNKAGLIDKTTVKKRVEIL